VYMCVCAMREFMYIPTYVWIYLVFCLPITNSDTHSDYPDTEIHQLVAAA